MNTLFKTIGMLTGALLSITPLFAQTTPATPYQNPLADEYYPSYPPMRLTSDPVKNAQIKQGEYLAKMGDCIACHTNMDKGTPAYAGGLPLETPFGTFYTPNITPDRETGIGNWTEQDFVRALKEGRSPDGSNYFPVFPYIYFSKMSDEDAKALYAYFMSLSPVHQKNKAQPFPFNVPGARFTLWGWNLLFFFPEENEVPYHADRSPQWNRGKYIVDGLGHCGMCHTPLSLFGSPKQRYYLSGGFVDGFWAPNITKYGLRSATHQQVTHVFSEGELINKAGPVSGPMAEVNHNSLRYLTEADHLAIATYLKTVISDEMLGVTAPSDAPPSLPRGQEVYRKACDVCHQQGVMSAPAIGDAANWYRRLQHSGLTGLYRHTINGYNSMPVKGACVMCSDNDLISAVDFILNASLTRSQWDDVANRGAQRFPSSGAEVYADNCAVCHNEGKDGAPKFGDKALWNEMMTQQTMDQLILTTMRGKHHPKNGGCVQCTTGELIEAIKYMVSQSTTEGNYSLW